MCTRILETYGDGNQLGCGETVAVLLNNTWVIKIMCILVCVQFGVFFVDIQDKLDDY